MDDTQRLISYWANSINRESFRLPNNTVAQIARADMAFPIRLRAWDSSYIPNQDLVNNTPIETSKANSENQFLR